MKTRGGSMARAGKRARTEEAKVRRGVMAAVAERARAATFIGVFAALLPACGTFTGCTFGAVQSVSADVPPTGWRDPVQLVYRNADTLAPRRTLTLSLAHGAAAMRTEGRYVLRSVSPRGAATSDTLVIAISPDPRRGNRLSEAHAPSMSVTFAEQGDYRFTVTPLQNTIGVWSAAITLSKAPYGKR